MNYTPPANGTDPDRTRKRIVIFIALLAGFLTPFDGSAVNIALPTIGVEFGMDAISLSWVATAYLLASALFLVPFGRIADIYGRKKVYEGGIIIFTVASLVMTMVPTTGTFILIRVIQGLGASMIYGTAMAILTGIFSPGERGKVLGLYISFVYLGLSVGPFLGGVLTSYLGWRSIFLVNVPIGILAVLMIRWKLDGEWVECKGERFDLIGTILYGISLVMVMYGFSILPQPTAVSLIVTGLILAGVFAWYENRNKFPVLNVNLFFKNRVFLFSNIAALINYSATYAVTFLLSLDLQYTKGFSPEHAGLILIAQPVVMAIVSVFSGRLSDKMDPGRVASAGMAVTTVGLFLLVFLTDATPLWYIILSLLILGTGFGFFTSPNTNAIMSSVERHDYGVASGTTSTMRLLGQMLSMGFATMLFAIYIGPVQITPAYYPQFIAALHFGFLFFTLLCITGIIFSLIRGTMEIPHDL
ncbi:MAG: MFS transporter [Methanospirillum sp.]|uniref:MFS transporter n=1 Tax=Methanospirillum sp. TaxID=45200 RepID=UPI002369177B|nr:MFS transporter [Methanospirillum sp.]MDD1729409.1 MFS transporter [Methanospirillum sp.]